MATPRVDLGALARSLGVDLDVALAALKSFYADIDARNAHNTRDLNLPCQKGCDACCKESVFLTPLEFFAVWDYVQTHLSETVRDGIVAEGLRLYSAHRALIEALEGPMAETAVAETGRLDVAQQLRFRCPLLGQDGACSVYPVRELYARMFGCSFNDQAGIYGCHLVGAHLGGRTVTLLRVESVAQQLSQLPLTFKRQVYPYYIHLLYG